MNYADALSKAEELLAIAKKIRTRSGVTAEDYEQFAQTYGALSEIVDRLVPKERVQVRATQGMGMNTVNNYIEAGYMSGMGTHEVQGWNQLNQLVGRLRQLAVDPSPFRPESSISAVSECLRRFREYCQYLREPPTSEAAVQEIMWIMLRAQFDRLERETTLPKFGIRQYRPDFGIPDLRLLIEAKFIGSGTNPSTIQESILADIPGYLSSAAPYDSVIVLVYDYAQKLRDSRKFVEDLRTVQGIVDVIVVPGIGVAA